MTFSLKIVKHINFMEKKIKRTTNSAKSGSYSREEKTIIFTILVALVIMGILLVNLTVFTPKETEPFSAIYYLDSKKQTSNIPKTVVLGENSTFSVWVGIENQNNKPMTYSVRVKLDDGTLMNSSLAETIESFEVTLLDGKTKETPVTINIDQLGHNRINFELWYYNGTILENTGNWVNLSIEAQAKQNKIQAID